MKLGYQYTLDHGGHVFSVWYRAHFADRYEHDYPDRPAAKKSITEKQVRDKIELALPYLSEIVESGTESAEGVIVSLLDRFSMVFSLVKFPKGFQINMVTIDPKVDFKPKNPTDVVIQVNPEYTVRFEIPVPSGMRVAILSSLKRELEVMENEVPYHLSSEIVEYWAVHYRDKVYVEDAHWIGELYEIDVP